ncbi:hypothetical protein N6H14_16430 [Paenibacillus sp. CC-CFT747]|nr:hypothetical protein N6H14_16430 [Paenibacillus sp. CC-CFT747]
MAPLGLYYKINHDLDPDGKKTINYRNLMFLEDYLLEETPRYTDHDKNTVVDIVKGNPGILLVDLLKRAKTAGVTADTLYTLLVRNYFYIDLHKFALAEPEFAQVYLDEELYRALTILNTKSESAVQYKLSLLEIKPGEKINWDGVEWTFLNIGEKNITAVDINNNVAQLSYELLEKLVATKSIIGLSLPAETCKKAQHLS